MSTDSKISTEAPLTERLSDLYLQTFGQRPLSIRPLGASGSNRRYYRLADGEGVEVIGTYGPDVEENRAFVRLSAELGRAGVRVPEVYTISRDGYLYLQQDLGDVSLYSLLHDDGTPALIEACMCDLARLQIAGTYLVTDSGVWQPPYGARQAMYDLNYFKYMYLRAGGFSYDEEKLQDDFEAIAAELADIDERCTGLMYRDCQSRNVMVKDGNCWWIDFQGARRGPYLYDAVSFLWQARAGFSDTERERYLNVYGGELATLLRLDIETVLHPLPLLVLLRTLQVLGAYGLRGLIEKKAQFIDTIPAALSSLRAQIESGALHAWPELESVCRKVADDRRFVRDSTDILTVEVYSFSYKRGYPADYSGNGGGFMFDCRGLHNPGRYERYKSLTGLDAEVKEFLEERGEIQTFLQDSWRLTDSTIERYLRRGFTRLQIGYGCTGGRHRSVYSAEATARHIKSVWGERVKVMLYHREQELKREVKESDGKQAFVLAAGLGSRLKPWTLHHPKALVPVGGRPMLERVIENLQKHGFSHIALNVHHFAEQIEEFLSANLSDCDVKVSDERDRLLDTGGGLLKARSLFSSYPVLVHNVDILSDADLDMLYSTAVRTDATTLLLSRRSSTRQLLWDKEMNLCGWHNTLSGEYRPADIENRKDLTPYAFSGIYVVSRQTLDEMARLFGEDSSFSIIDYLVHPERKQPVKGLLNDNLHLIDIGKPETLSRAEDFLNNLSV
ncbi:MAG: phosphotransferase [Muribaculaceae bacterium]|nr:phosphotransferase [Muribaculaceae bacterium]